MMKIEKSKTAWDNHLMKLSAHVEDHDKQ